jgi:predicted phosphodiesterase
VRIAVVSDIHGNMAALSAVVADFGRHGVDAVVNLGDSLSGPLLPLETARFLMATAWIHLAGNHERQLLTQGPGRRSASDEYAHGCLSDNEFAWMAALKPRLPFSDTVLLCHGTPASDLEYFLETVEASGVRAANAAEVDQRLGGERAALVLCGHTHVPRAVRSSGGTLIVNPGSVGLQAYSDDHPFEHAIQNGSPDARYAIVEDGPWGWRAALRSVPYDHRPMARLAAQRQRPDWERALLTGYV